MKIQPRQSLWRNLVEKKEPFIGGFLVEQADPDLQPLLQDKSDEYCTIITDITLTPNGPSELFTVVGATFECAADVQYLAIDCNTTHHPWLVFRGYGGHTFKICARANVPQTS